MAGSLEGRVAVVTGAGPVGRAVAAAFAAEGARVAVLHDGTAGEPQGLDALVRRADVSVPAQVEAAFADVVAELGEVDVLVAGATHHVLGSFLETREAELRRCVEVDVRGALLCMQRVARRLIERGAPGRLILLGTSAGLRTVPGSFAHGIVKAMEGTLAQVAAMELAPHGVTCNLVAAGWTPSSFLDEQVDRELAVAATPAARLIEPVEVGAMCAFLAGDAAAAVNGAVIPVDGGYSIAKSPGGSPIRHAFVNSRPRVG
ncbi:MAG: SDR family oxidoreductase [Actinobacteria bacterium]|nr:SDR family oxidoreductase [Actinomycetota bacterium]